MYNVPAIIFAGGKSSRMGTDKALLPFKNFSTLSEYQYQKLHTLFTDVFISAKEDKFDFSCLLIKDQDHQSSPLVALVSIFDFLKEDAVFILSVDAPLIDKTIISTLYAAFMEETKAEAVIAQSPHGLQPLCGFYRRSILPLAKQYLTEDRHKLMDLLKASSAHIVTFNEEKPFTNLNTPQEYETLLLS